MAARIAKYSVLVGVLVLFAGALLFSVAPGSAQDPNNPFLTPFPPGGIVGTPNPFFTPGTPLPTFTPTITPLPPIPPGAQTATIIRATALIVRDGPFLSAARIDRALRGETYQVVGRDSDARWFLIQLYGRQGWVYGYYVFVSGNEFSAPIVSPNVVQPPPAPSTNVVGQTQAGLRLRAEPNTNSAQTGRIIWGSLLPVLARTSDGVWLKVQWRGTVGWTVAEYVRIIEGDLSTVPIEGY